VSPVSTSDVTPLLIDRPRAEDWLRTGSCRCPGQRHLRAVGQQPILRQEELRDPKKGQSVSHPDSVDIWIITLSNEPVAQRLRRAEQVERNRDVVLTAARHVFLTKGYTGATLEAVASEAGFSTGVVYSQFGSKADLFLALLERRIDERADQNERVAAEMPGAEGLRELMRVAGRDSAADQGWARLLVEFRMVAARDPHLNARYAALHRETRERLTSVLRRLHDGASLEPVLPVESMAEFILAVGVGTTVERAADPAALADEDLMVILPRALGLPDVQRAARAASAPTN
jgi:AcrR family transcriptional regulator